MLPALVYVEISDNAGVNIANSENVASPCLCGDGSSWPAVFLSPEKRTIFPDLFPCIIFPT